MIFQGKSNAFSLLKQCFLIVKAVLLLERNFLFKVEKYNDDVIYLKDHLDIDE